MPDERIVRLGRADNFWQAGPTGPCGPCSELYLDRGEEFGAAGERPGDDTDRFLEFWNHVFMTYDLAEDGALTELPMRNIDTGMGLDRMAAILQDVPSVFETDLLRPLIDLAEELSGRSYEEGGAVTRAMRIVADHSRGAAFLIADGVVPSNEDRGYILRRIMRRAIQQGRTLGLEAPWLGRFAERTIEIMGEAYPELAAERETIARWVGDEEESFGRTLERGTELLERLVAEAKESETSWIDAADAFKLHDTYGFPYDLTKELLAEQGLSVDDGGFEELMEEQRQRARVGAATAHGSEDRHEQVIAFAAAAPPTRFVGYETLRATTGLAAVEADDGRALVKLEESPFYAEGGGQVADSGVLRWDGGEAKVVDVYRVGDDQALEVEPANGAIEAGVAVEAVVDRETRHATMRNHTATHLLHAALRERLGDPRPPGRLGGPPRQAALRLHPRPGARRRGAARRSRTASTSGSRRAGRCAGWRWSAPRPSGSARWRCSARNTASGCGWSRSTASRASSAAAPTSPTPPRSGSSRSPPRGRAPPTCAGSRRSPARPRSTGSASARRSCARSASCSARRRTRSAGARRAAERLREAGEGAKQADEAAARRGGRAAGRRGGRGRRRSRSSPPRAPLADQKQLLDLANRVQSKLGGDVGGRPRRRRGRARSASSSSSPRARSSAALSAAAIVREAAPVVGGGGGGRDDMAQAGGKRRRRSSTRRWRPRARRSSGGSAEPMRVLALDHGTARIGCAISDPSGTLATPLPVIEPPEAARGRRAGRRARGRAGRRRAAAAPQRRGGHPGGARPAPSAPNWRRSLDVPVETYDERLTTRMAEASRREGATAPPDSLAAAHLLEAYLAGQGGDRGARRR